MRFQATYESITQKAAAREGDPGRGGLQGARPCAWQLGGPASRSLKTFPSVGGRDAGGRWTVFTGYRFQDSAERSASLV
eukprot:1194817-Prorocentrum_minimum.AAC.2